MFKKLFNCFVAFRDANKEPFNHFTSAWTGKSLAVLNEERSYLTFTIIFGFLSAGAAIIFGSPTAPIPSAISDAISLNLPAYFLFSGATICLIPLLINKDIVQKLNHFGNFLMKSALYNSALFIGVLLSILIIGRSSHHEKPNGFYFIFPLGIAMAAVLMTYTIFGLSFSEAYKVFKPTSGRKIWIFLLFTVCLYSIYYIFKH